MNQPSDETLSCLRNPFWVFGTRLELVCRFYRFTIHPRGGNNRVHRLATSSGDRRFRLFVVNPEQNVKVIVHDAETTDGDSKDLIKLFEPLIDPIFPIVGPIILQEPRGAYASGNGMIPTRYVCIDKPKPSCSHRIVSHESGPTISRSNEIITHNHTAATIKCLSFLCWGCDWSFGNNA